MQALDRLILDELEVMNAFDAGFEDEFDSFLEDEVEAALDEASQGSLTRQIAMRRGLARPTSQQRTILQRSPISAVSRRIASSSANRVQRPGLQRSPISSNGSTIPSPPTNRNSPEYIRWVQVALNKAMGLQLRVDGILGPETIAAIRNFQRQKGLTVDGKVGRETERALTGRKADAIIDKFDFDSSKLKPSHLLLIDQVAKKIAQSWEGGQPIFTVRLIGHTDPVGTPNYNMGLGSRRGMAVLNQLKRSLEDQKKGLSYKVLILVESKGERQPIDPAPNEEARARNRRVEVFLSTEILQPIKPKPPTGEGEPKLPPHCQGKLNAARQPCHDKYRAEYKKCEEDLEYIGKLLIDAAVAAGCTLPTLVPGAWPVTVPAAIACLIIAGGMAAKDLIDEYYRRNKCFNEAQSRLIDCNERVLKEFCQENRECCKSIPK
jgi:outer membrane protein OmpA-like peptidoglycan-associated protein